MAYQQKLAATDRSLYKWLVAGFRSQLALPFCPSIFLLDYYSVSSAGWNLPSLQQDRFNS